MSNVLSGLLSFLQKCCYIWRPRKCLRLDVANLIILFRKMERKFSLNFSKNFCVCVYFSFFLETFRKFVEKIPKKKTNKHTKLKPTDLISYMFIVVKVILKYILTPLQ